MHSFFASLKLAPPDPILKIPVLFSQDHHAHKVNLGIGSYKSEKGKSVLLSSVLKAEERVVASKAPKDYLPMEGDPLFLEKSIELVLGKNSEGVFALQTVGDTSALRIAASFCAHFLSPIIAIPTPTWPAHPIIFQGAGLNVHEYPYYDLLNHRIDFQRMLDALQNLPPASLVLLQVACHNPTGADLTPHQWEEILKVVQKNNLLPFFDNAYQGFGESLEEDVFPIRLFHENQIEMAIASSCAKNFGLYSERVGSLIFALNDPKQKNPILSQIRQIIRSMYSSPPAHGAKIVATILSHPELKKEWEQELGHMRERIIGMRHRLSQGLIEKSGDRTYAFIAKERGFFSLMGMTKSQIEHLRDEKGIFLLDNGRINIAGLTPGNIEYVIDSFLHR